MLKSVQKTIKIFFWIFYGINNLEKSNDCLQISTVFNAQNTSLKRLINLF